MHLFLAVRICSSLSLCLLSPPLPLPSSFSASYLLVHILPGEFFVAFSFTNVSTIIPPSTFQNANPCMYMHTYINTHKTPLRFDQTQPFLTLILEILEHVLPPFVTPPPRPIPSPEKTKTKLIQADGTRSGSLSIAIAAFRSFGSSHPDQPLAAASQRALSACGAVLYPRAAPLHLPHAVTSQARAWGVGASSSSAGGGFGELMREAALAVDDFDWLVGLGWVGYRCSRRCACVGVFSFGSLRRRFVWTDATRV